MSLNEIDKGVYLIDLLMGKAWRRVGVFRSVLSLSCWLEVEGAA